MPSESVPLAWGHWAAGSETGFVDWGSHSCPSRGKQETSIKLPRQSQERGGGAVGILCGFQLRGKNPVRKFRTLGTGRFSCAAGRLGFPLAAFNSPSDRLDKSRPTFWSKTAQSQAKKGQESETQVRVPELREWGKRTPKQKRPRGRSCSTRPWCCCKARISSN